MSLFKGQSLFTLIVDTGLTDLTDATVTRIYYTKPKPNSTTGFWEGTISGTKLIYNIENGDIDRAGVWRFQSYVEIGDRNGKGKVATQTFEQPII